MEHLRHFTCDKCGHGNFEVSEFRATGGLWSKFFNIQHKRFKTISCTNCGYTEIYTRPKGKAWEDVVDFFIG